MASPRSVILCVCHGATGTEVRIAMALMVPTSAKRTSVRKRSSHSRAALEHDMPKRFAGHMFRFSGQVEPFAFGAEGPHQVAARIVEMRAGMRELVVAAEAIDGDAIDVLQRDEQAMAVHARHQRQAVQELRSDASPRPLVEENL